MTLLFSADPFCPDNEAMRQHDSEMEADEWNLATIHFILRRWHAEKSSLKSLPANN